MTFVQPANQVPFAFRGKTDQIFGRSGRFSSKFRRTTFRRRRIESEPSGLEVVHIKPFWIVADIRTTCERQPEMAESTLSVLERREGHISDCVRRQQAENAIKEHGHQSWLANEIHPVACGRNRKCV